MEITRRSFLESAALAPAALRLSEPPLRVGLVGCGGRGTAAAENVLQAASNVNVVALADLFPERVEKCRKVLGIDDARGFTGPDAYRRLMESDVDYVLLCTPPGFRPEQFEAAVAAGKHAFVEKPIAVDPAGVRRFLAAGKKAKEKNLGVLAGTMFRHDRRHQETVKRIHDGQIGEIRSVRSLKFGGGLWSCERRPGQSDIEWQIRNWLYFDWLSGDFLVEMHIHELDVVDWILGKRPESAVATGGRQVRVEPVYGNIYDHFALDYRYPGDIPVTHLARQMNGTAEATEIRVVGSKGVATLHDGVIQGEHPWRFEGRSPNPWVQEHADLIASLRAGGPINEAEQVAGSTLTTILGREAAYTGRRIKAEELAASELVLGPRDRAFGPYEPRPVPVPGKAR